MRQLGTLSSETKARQFQDYMTSKSMSVHVDSAGENEWELWIVDEDHLDEARSEFQAFQEEPNAERFREGARLAADLRAEKEKQAIERIRRNLKIKRQASPPKLTGFSVTSFLIVGSVVITLLTQLNDAGYGSVSQTDFTICDYRSTGDGMIKWYPGFREIRSGEVWRLFTPAFLHFHPFHLLFNMYWLYIFGMMLEPRMGWWRFLLMVLLIGALSNLGEYYIRMPQMVIEPSPSFGGMSGVNYGLFGFIWIKGQLEPHGGIVLPDFTIYIMLGFLVLCMTGLLGPIANAAHTFGLAIGCLLAWLSTLQRRG